MRLIFLEMSVEDTGISDRSVENRTYLWNENGEILIFPSKDYIFVLIFQCTYQKFTPQEKLTRLVHFIPIAYVMYYLEIETERMSNTPRM